MSIPDRAVRAVRLKMEIILNGYTPAILVRMWVDMLRLNDERGLERDNACIDL